MYQEPGIIEHQKISAIVENVTQARAEVAAAFALLQSAKQRLAATVGTYYDNLWSERISDYALERTAEESAAYIEQQAWRYALNQIGITGFMTERRQKELQEQLDKGQFPALTTANVLSTLEGLTSQVGSLLQESALEVFNWLRPAPNSWRGTYKTNKQFEVGEKVIVSGIESTYGGGFRINHYRTNDFRALGNVFSLLDGQGVKRYPHDMPTQLNHALQGCASGETICLEYFTCKPFQNGNLHIRFTRMDLVDTLNAMGADGSLPGTEHQRAS